MINTYFLIAIIFCLQLLENIGALIFIDNIIDGLDLSLIHFIVNDLFCDFTIFIYFYNLNPLLLAVHLLDVLFEVLVYLIPVEFHQGIEETTDFASHQIFEIFFNPVLLLESWPGD